MVQNCLQTWRTRQYDLACRVIRIEYGITAPTQELGHGALSRTYASGKPDDFHQA
jgi:hypothetical protein